MKDNRILKKTLLHTLRDITIFVVLLGLVLGGAALWNELRQAAAAEHEMPALPNTQEDDSEPRVDFDGLRREAPGAVAWITVPETLIDYPVVQHTDNQYFVNRTARHEHSRFGAIFMDYRNCSGLSDFYTVLYGHNMRSGRMFGDLQQFQNADFFNRVRYGALQAPDARYRLQFFAFVLADAASEYYNNLFFLLPGEREAFIGMIKETASLWRDIPLGPEDRIVALSTCYASPTGSERMLLLGKLIEQ